MQPAAARRFNGTGQILGLRAGSNTAEDQLVLFLEINFFCLHIFIFCLFCFVSMRKVQ